MLDPVEEAKRRAAYAVVDEYVKSGMVLGIGSGSTVVYAVERIAQRVKSDGLSLKACVPSSFQAVGLIESNGLPLSTIQVHPSLDLAIDGMDEADDQLNLIKGGGGCQLQEKIVAAAAKKFIVMADFRKDSAKLGQQWKKGIPLEVLPLAYRFVLQRLPQIGAKQCTLRMCSGGKAGPVVTDNGNFIVDADFGIIDHPQQVEASLKRIPGILETGLFCGMAEKAFFGMGDGSVRSRGPKGN